MPDLCSGCPLPRVIEEIKDAAETQEQKIVVGFLELLRTVYENGDPDSYTGPKTEEHLEELACVKITECCQEEAQLDNIDPFIIAMEGLVTTKRLTVTGSSKDGAARERIAYETLVSGQLVETYEYFEIPEKQDDGNDG